MRLIVSVFAFGLVASCPPARADKVRGGTCRGFIKTALTAIRSQDNTGMYAYMDFAEKSYPVLADIFADELGIPSLALLSDPLEKGKRAARVVEVCAGSLGLPYVDAVTKAYIAARLGEGRVKTDSSLIGRGMSAAKP